MDNIIDYQEISDAFQKEWLEHPLILTDDDTHPGLTLNARTEKV